MTSSEIVTMFRNEMGDRVAPYLWDDSEVYPFLDDAQSWFCRKTDGIADARTPTVCNLSVVAGTDWYATHPSILIVRKITRADNGLKVSALTVEQADDLGVVFLATTLGKVKYVVFGYDAHAVRITPMPNEVVTLNLAVFRLPLVTITDIGDQALEIDAQHHAALVKWMKFRAYSKQDTETADRNKASDFEAQFLAYCANAKLEQARARRVQGNVTYGGLPVGGRVGQLGSNSNRYSPY